MIQQEIFVQMALRAWNIQLNTATELIAGKSDEALLDPVAPGKNRLIYLVGHLIAVNDSMLPLFDMGERRYAHYDDLFLRNPDNPAADMPSAAELRQAWFSAREELNALFIALPSKDWLGKHSAMSEDDYLNEPTRNKLSVLLNRTNHLAYHLGQMVLAK